MQGARTDARGEFGRGVADVELAAGDVGFVVAGIKEIDGAPVGDTITLENRPAATPEVSSPHHAARGAADSRGSAALGKFK